METTRAVQEIDHVAIEQPGLLDLAGVSRARKNLQLAVLDAILQRKRRFLWMLSSLPVRMIDGHVIARLVILGIDRRMRLELMDDRVDVAEPIALVNMSAKNVASGVPRNAGLMSSKV